MSVNKSITSTYDDFIAGMTPHERKKYKAEYQEILLSELILAMMHEKPSHAEQLAHLAKLPPGVLKEINTNKESAVTLQVFLQLLNRLNYEFELEKHGIQIAVSEEIIHGS